MKKAYVIGIDYGTDSARALLVDALTGEEIADSVCAYSRWAKGWYCDPHKMQFRQHPLDYLESLRFILKEVLAARPDVAPFVRAIAVDTTGSTPCLIDAHCTPLALKPEYAENPDAMFVLWKDHTAHAESEEIVDLCARSEINYARYSGNYYSSENYWSKVLHLLRGNSISPKDAYAAIELCDWIPAVLTGCDDLQKLRPGRCITGAKLMWAQEWGGYPPRAFFEALHPDMAAIACRLNPRIHNCDIPAGKLSPDWAKELGLSEDVLVGVGNVDSHSGAVGAGVEHGTVVLNMGTSACYMTVMPMEKMGGRLVPGIFNQVDGSILPDMVGFEVGLSAFGDVYAWLKRLLSWPLREVLMKSAIIDDQTRNNLIAETEEKIISELSIAAEQLPLRDDAPLATDYLNGRRSPNPNAMLTGSLTGLHLSTTAPEIFYALVESTAFATKAVLDYLEENEIDINRLIGVGGISQKSSFVMQMMADVTGREIHVSDCKQSCALGAVIHAATVAGIYTSVTQAQQALCRPIARIYFPDAGKSAHYLRRYARYRSLGEFSESLLAR